MFSSSKGDKATEAQHALAICVIGLIIEPQINIQSIVIPSNSM